MMRDHLDILLVEDNPADAVLFSRLLSECDRIEKDRIQVAPDGEKAYEQLQACAANGSKAPDLIFLDLNLPRISGLELLQLVRDHETLSGLPIIIMSSSFAPDDVRKAYALHANAYVRKPVDLADMRELMRALEAFWLRTACLPGDIPT